ncbi:MAG: PKD domain-containing protein, partial [Flavitalea sp.]
MKILFIALFVLLSVPVFAQPKADFTVDKTGGCTPLSVAFTNTSTGLSASAIYEWSFDNGNISSLKNASAIFIEERIYKVTLTVKDGNLSSSTSLDITVYKKPTLDFEISVTKGCFPLPVELKATATSNGETITNYFWDFGDGNTSESSSSSINHTYTYATDPNINLTVTTSNGCQQTLTKEKLVKVLPRLDADFVSDKDFLCKITDAATFTNKSVGPGTLTYAWEFGDGTTSTSKNPSHKFAAIGTYNIKLTTTSSEGCVTVMEKPSFINAANFKTDFSSAGVICERAYISFTNQSSPSPNESIWEFNNGMRDYSIYTPYIYFNEDGPNKLTLINKFGSCYDTLTKIIDVKRRPDVGQFKAELLDSCGGPARVRFTDTSSGGVKWEWAPTVPYNYAPSQITQTNETIIEIDRDGYYSPMVRVYTAEGCFDDGYSSVTVLKPQVYITDSYSELANSTANCGPITTTLKATGSSEIISYEWDLGNGTKSTLPNPTVTYSNEGFYYVILKYKMKNGCTGVQPYNNTILVENKRKIDFKSSTQDVCGNTPVTFESINPYNNKYIYYRWHVSYEGGEFQEFGYGNFVFHKFQEEGKYSIRLSATNGLCGDTLQKTEYIKVAPPFPRITNVEHTCVGDRGLVTFTQQSTKTNSWTWDFGDGSPVRTLNSNQDTVKYHYTKTGIYKVKLTNVNGACTVSDSLTIPVLLKQKPRLALNTNEVCSDGNVTFFVDNLERNPFSEMYNSQYYGYSTWPIEYGDGSYFNGNTQTYTELTKLPFTNRLYNLTPEQRDLRIIIRSEFFECTDTTNVFPLKINGPIADFKIANDSSCAQGNIVLFQDQSATKNNNPLINWEWTMYNESVVQKKDGKIFPYQFANSYPQLVTLKVTDSKGCTNYISKEVRPENNTIEAALSSSATVVSPGSTIYFFNNSKTSDEFNTSYTWIKSDGTTLTNDYSISETFGTPGFYTVKIIAKNHLKNCVDTASIQIQVKYINAAFDINPLNINVGKCLPVVVKFTNKSYNISRITWDFGDGNTAENVFSPSHVYTKPGKYIITAKAYSDNNTLYTTIDSVFIETPTPSIATNIYEACTAQDITLSGNRTAENNYTWDLGDGTITSTSDSFFVHKFKNAGVYTPTLIQTDKNGCAVAVKLKEAIIIDSLSIALNNLPAKICSPKELLFNPSIYSVA